MLSNAHLAFILLFIPLISAQPTPTKPPNQSTPAILRSTTSPAFHPDEFINSPPDIPLQTYQTGNINRVETRAGMDDYLWISDVLHTVEKAVQREDEDSLLELVTTPPAEDKVEEGKGRTVVMNSSTRRRRRRRVHP